jgi:hypothetical protein
VHLVAVADGRGDNLEGNQRQFEISGACSERNCGKVVSGQRRTGGGDANARLFELAPTPMTEGIGVL